MTETVTVECGARLHLGFLDLNCGLGRRFGSLGLALMEPATRLVLRRATQTKVRGPETDRAARHLDTLTAMLGLHGAHALAIETAAPAHAGLGSGTLLALAVASAVRRLHRLPPDLRGDATALGRGARSGVGIGLFETGGLALDGGRGAQEAPPPLLARLAVPEDWRALLLFDPARAGLSGGAERNAFAALPPMPDTVAAESCRRVVMQALPAVAEGDLVAFGEAVSAIQRAAGDHFAPAQGGRITSPRVAAALDLLARSGAHGLGQSSWGPTGFAFVPDPDMAAWLCDRVRTLADAPEAMVARPRNHGAMVDVSDRND